MYGAMLISMDENIGRILDALDRMEIANDTLVVLASDNGPSMAYNVDWPEDWPRELLGSAGPLRGYKGQYTEGGIRVPFILRWPGVLPEGHVFDDPVSTLDLYPTFAALADADLPATVHLDGENLMPHLNASGETPLAERTLFWTHDGEAGAVRAGDWKLLYARSGMHALFHLKDDPGERNDLADAKPDIASELQEEFEAFVERLPPPLNPK